MMNLLRIQHKLTAHHWRDNRKNPYKLALCDCGWKDKTFRKIERKTQRRYIFKLCWLRGHKLEEPYEIHVGPVDFDESEDTLLATSRQCERCYKVLDVDYN